MKKTSGNFTKGTDNCHYKHGECMNYRHSRLYITWARMKQRCYDINDKSYKYYGGRGIDVCNEWHDSKTFIEWALNSGYTDNLTIDRINNNDNYNPDNCRFITLRENIMRKPKRFMWGVYKTKWNRWEVFIGKRINGKDLFFRSGNYQCKALALMKRDELRDKVELLTIK